MTRRKLQRLRQQIASLRRSQPKARVLIALAKALGRMEEDRGKEPTYCSEEFQDLSPLTIPMHKGRDLPPGTRDSILNQLDEDVDAWDQRLFERERTNGGS
jgi:hypothetical protein